MRPIDNPTRVCSELFAPGLAQTYANAANGSCDSYFAQITSFSVKVRRMLRDGGTAVLELRQTVHPEGLGGGAGPAPRRLAGGRPADGKSGALSDFPSVTMRVSLPAFTPSAGSAQ